MLQLLIKATVSGILVALASEAAKRSSLIGAILVSLPLTSLLALWWLWAETNDSQQVAALSWSILWVVLPSVVFFVAAPLLIRAGAGVPLALALSVAITAVAYAGWTWALTRIGIEA